MNEPSPEASRGAVDETRPCPACLEPIHRKARKCHHCGETVRERKMVWWRRLPAQLGAALGVATAVLSLFYTLREGYYWVAERQEQRATVRSYRAVAARFEQFDNLDYAEHALRKAIELKPDDISLKRHHFLLGAHMRLRELEDWPATSAETIQPEITALVLEGFRLLEFTSEARDRARILTMLGRLLYRDTTWTDEAHVGRLLDEARKTAPDDAEAVFRHGLWLVTEDKENPLGETSLREATRLDPGNALYWAMLGEHLSRTGRLREAFAVFRTAVDLRSSQQELQRIRASNASRRSAADVLRAAATTEDITGTDFLGMTMEERRDALEQSLELNPNDRALHHLAARYYHATGDHARARSQIVLALSEPDLSHLSSTDGPTLDLYAAILEKTGDDLETLARVRELQREQQEDRQFDEILEIGGEGEPGYRIGLRVHAGSSDAGVLVARAFEAYPFANAGVQETDRIVSVAHRKTRNLRDIWLRVMNFEHGTSIPFQVSRDGTVLDLTLVVE